MRKKSMKPGGGGRFQAMAKKMAAEGMDDPKAAAAAIGRKKYGKKGMAKMAAKGRSKAARAKRLEHVEL